MLGVQLEPRLASSVNIAKTYAKDVWTQVQPGQYEEFDWNLVIKLSLRLWAPWIYFSNGGKDSLLTVKFFKAEDCQPSVLLSHHERYFYGPKWLDVIPTFI